MTGAALSLVFFVVFSQPVILFGLALDVAVIVALFDSRSVALVVNVSAVGGAER